ncbi:hypothetical protein Tco_0856496 [Tanacetum coccineum]|uniref:Uncharacterized protein n=1 Tax=Tanacetum coccineum TaxID=301880 RepID=A0ABQ5B5B6_9ASTR
MYQPWRTFASIINRCLSGKISLDRLRLSRVQILWGLFHKKDVDFAELLWEDFHYQTNYRQTSVRRRKSMPYPRFTKVFIHHFLSKHKSMSKRHGLFMITIKHDAVLGRLKFVNKGKDNQRYGMSIPDVMVNNDIKNSKAYQTYLALSTGVIILKKARKGMKTTATPIRRSSISADEDMTPDPEEATRKPTCVVSRDTLNVSKKKTLDQSQKLKGIEMLSDAAQLEIDTQKAIKASRRAHRIQQQTGGSSEGSGITPEVLDKQRPILLTQVKELGSDEEEIILTSEDERTQSEREVAESQKSDEETADDEHVHTDDEYYDDKTDKHDDADMELNNVDNTDAAKDDQEMANAEKASSKKTEEEKHDDQLESTAQNVLQKTPALLAQSSSTHGQSSSKQLTSGVVNPDQVQRKRDRGDDQDPNTGLDKGKKKKRKGKDSKPSKDKVETGSSSKGKTQSKPSSTIKPINPEEPLHESEMDMEESI